MGRIQGKFPAVVAFVAIALTAGTAIANSASQRHYARGLIAFQAGEWAQAYERFSDAVQADPADASAHYYKGVTGARLGFAQQSIADLENALQIRPDFQQAVIDLGVLYLDAGEYERAESWLQRAYEVPSNRFRAALFLGVTHFRRGNDTTAQEFLRTAAKSPRLRPAASYYEGLSLLRQGKKKAAKTSLAKAEQGLPGTDVAAAVSAFRAGEGATVFRQGDDKPWSVYGDLGIAFDSNVNLKPSNSTRSTGALPVGAPGPDYSDDAVGRLQIGLGGRYRILDHEMAVGTIGYELYQGVNFNNSDFNLSSHRLRFDIGTRANTWYQFGATAYYNFYALDFSSFFNEGTIIPWVVFYEGEIAATQVYYRLRTRDYASRFFSEPRRESLNTGPAERDAINNAIGIRQMFLLGAADRSLTIGYQWSDNDPTDAFATDFAYQTHQLDLELQANVLGWFDTSLGYAVLIDDYDHPNSRTGFRFGRNDAEHQIVIRAERPINEMLTASIDYLGVLNHSNLDEFDYDRSIISAGVRMGF